MKWVAFSNPWMLAALAAAALPVMIHFLTKARPKKVAFPPFKFLQEACAGQQALHRLRQWILLAVRTLLIACLVLLFARPFLKPVGSADAESSKERVVLIVDASLSMRAVQAGVTFFDRAKAEAAEILRQLDSGQEAAVILAGASPHPVLPAMSRNIPALHQALVSAKPTYERAELRSALAKAAEIFDSRPGTLYIFSDFQKSNWEDADELPPGVQCRLWQVAQVSAPNVALTNLRLEPAEPVAGEPAEVICRVFNCTSQPREEIVRLQLGELTQERRVQVPPFGSADSSFSVAFPREGPVTGRAWMDPDDLPEDNSRYIAARVHKAVKILLVSDSDESDTRSAAFFVSRALAPSEAAVQGLKLIRRHSQDIDRGILESADVFVLTAPAALSGEAAENIGRRVREGARCLAILDGASPAALIPAGLTPPFRIIQAVHSPAGESILPGALRLFKDADQEDLLATKFHRHLRAEVFPDRAGEIAFMFSDGSPALSLSTFGEGSAAFANMPVTPDGGDFPGSPMFPATLHEVLRSLRRGTEKMVVNPGKPWTLETVVRREGGVEVTDPSGARINAQEIASGRVSRLALPPAIQPGVFVARQAADIVGAESVNVDARESDTRPLPLESIKTARGSSVRVVRGDQELALSTKSRQLWPSLAAASGSLLGIEMLLLGLWRGLLPPQRAGALKGERP
ncbi:MAG TPA: BatA domain-containing protein [Clostridia bacterium]|nr:BatA domain-containing protein [Clostridia bacterium]